jgi:hypothetical protein
MNLVNTKVHAVVIWTNPARGPIVKVTGRGTQVVRERSAKPLYVSSILTRASSLFLQLHATVAVRPDLSFRPGWVSMQQNRPILASGADKKRTRF